MAFRTVLKYGTDPSLQTLQGVIEKEGKPETITLQGLAVQTTHYAQAELYEDGGLQATSQNVRFTTLADSITLTFAQYRRQGDGTHKITYNYTSTYALTSAILYWDITAQRQGTCQGQIDSTNHVITFDVPNGEANGGMDGNGATYTIRAKGWDVYAVEGISADTSITTSTMNNVSITATATGQTTVDVAITKFLDSGWQSGVVKWWGENDNPATDTPLGSAAIQESTATYTVTGLTQGTTYQFRADITTASPSTTVGCAVVLATTAADAKGTELNFTNNSNAAATLWFKVGSYASGQESQTFVGNYKVNNGDWTSFTVDKQQYSGQYVNVTTVPSGGTVWLRSNTTKLCTSANRDNKLYLGDSNHTPVSTTVAGNILSLGHLQNGAWKGNSKVTPSAYEYANFFNGNTSISAIADISGLYLGNINPNAEGWGYRLFEGQTNITVPPTEMPTGVVGEYGMYEMFKDCSSMTTTPDFSGITTVNRSGLSAALQNCSSLTTLPNLSAITRVYSYGCKEMCSGCTSMTGTPVFAALTRVDTHGCELMFENTGLTGGANLSGVTTDGNYAFQQMYTWSTNLSKPGALPNIVDPSEGAYSNMYNSCFSLTAPPRMGHITTIGRFVCDGMFGGCSSLATTPDLTSVGRIGYYGCSAMFMSCTALETGADIRRATGYDTGMIADMYNGCTRLTTAYLPTPTDVNQFWSQCEPTNWLASVAASGHVISTSQAVLDGAPRNSASGIPANWTGVVQAV